MIRKEKVCQSRRAAHTARLSPSPSSPLDKPLRFLCAIHLTVLPRFCLRDNSDSGNTGLTATANRLIPHAVKNSALHAAGTAESALDLLLRVFLLPCQYFDLQVSSIIVVALSLSLSIDSVVPLNSSLR